MSLFPPRLGTKKVVHDPKYKFQNVSTYERTNGKTITKTEIKLPINGNKYAKHSINKKQINDNAKDAEDERKWYENIHSISSKIKKKYEENRTTDKNASVHDKNGEGLLLLASNESNEDDMKKQKKSFKELIDLAKSISDELKPGNNNYMDTSEQDNIPYLIERAERMYSSK